MRCRRCGQMLDSTGKCFSCMVKPDCGIYIKENRRCSYAPSTHRMWHEAVCDLGSSYGNNLDIRMGEVDGY